MDLSVQVSQAVEHARQMGIIPRDLKPSNILATSNDGALLPMIREGSHSSVPENFLRSRVGVERQLAIYPVNDVVFIQVATRVSPDPA